MDKYIGTKIIEAENGLAPKQMGEYAEGSDGYKVRYPDGYESWSPKSVFEDAYFKMSGMTFGLAIESMKKGIKVRLPYWGDDVFISIQEPDENSKMTTAYMFVTSRFGAVPWCATQIEMLSTDWMVAE